MIRTRHAGTLSNGKEFYGDASHASNNHLTAQEHAEAAEQLHDRAKRMMQGEQSGHDEFAIQHAKKLLSWARSHGTAARTKGLPRAA